MVTSSPEHEEKFLEWKRLAQLKAKTKGDRGAHYDDDDDDGYYGHNRNRRNRGNHWYNQQLNKDDGTGWTP